MVKVSNKIEKKCLELLPGYFCTNYFINSAYFWARRFDFLAASPQ